MLEFNYLSPELFTMPEYDIELVNMLSHSTSAKRRSAAKKLRKTKDTSAGSSLLNALQKEMKSSRTWETQYHMIMALSDCSYIESLPYLYELAHDQTLVPMISVAIGDAITNLENIKYNHVEKIDYWIAHKQNDYLEGAIRAIAMNRMIPAQEIIEILIEYVEISKNDGLVFWLAAACPGWSLDLTSEFLKSCLVGSSTDDIKKAAEAALVKKYLKWRPL
ncbi:hypothetical protein swp_2724 [Shewanella piezotolerans WP3]|uniref:HEAT repeat domain-containing protein n=1 Tax=Shewanella piezotolerans (strain WP3 / JCM 13877) TaxID=225849 RepID=B8CMR4_SHEPW|nr:hypothetical protein [Shewanella piezotolerans]ACJ29454.1 hypothetical protein swp_2724 [Shewanella piezotolerans WP3]